jgi:hypothetical protein
MQNGKARFPFRAVSIGLLVIVVLAVWATYVELHARSSRLTMGHFPLGLFALLLVLLGLNPILRWLRLSLLTSSELLIVVCMGLVGAIMPVDGVVGYLLGIISSFYYFATPENQWADHLHPYVPNWLVPRGNDAIWQQFFEASGSREAIPWSMWVPPLFWWATFIGALLWVSACIMVILRKQWMENERLAYPLAIVATELVGSGGEGGAFRAIWKNRLFWIGFGSALFLFLLQIVSWVFPYFPLGDYYPWIDYIAIFKDGRRVVINPFHFFTLGFAYLAPTEVQFSVWFFYFLNVAETAVFARVGYVISATGGDSFSTRPPAIAWQGFGAVIFIVFWGFWIARYHLGDVFRKAIKGDPSVDDSREMVSYRTAVVSGGAGLGFVALWLNQSGMDPLSIALYLFALFVLYIGMARIVVEGGVPYTWAPLSPQSFVVCILGTTTTSGPQITSILLSYTLINYLRGLFMPALAHVVKLGDALAEHRKRLLPIVVFGAGVSFVVSLVYTLGLAYDHGAYNTYGFPPFFGGNPKAIFSSTLAKIRNPFTPDPDRLLFLGGGAVVMALLTFLRSQLLWWRIHPIGFATACMINTNFLAVPFLLAWIAKSLAFALGGVQLYRKTLPLFIGLMVGYVAGVSLCSVVDMLFFPQDGHVVHTW